MTGRVVDSSVIARFLLKEAGWRDIEPILLERPYTLDLAIKEATNAIWRRVRLLRDISPSKALTLLNDLLDMRKHVLRVDDQSQYLPRALEIALDQGITVYDALFIAQAITRKARLTTADKVQYEASLRLGVEAELIE